jgi:hypothetical protein
MKPNAADETRSRQPRLSQGGGRDWLMGCRATGRSMLIDHSAPTSTGSSSALDKLPQAGRRPCGVGRNTRGRHRVHWQPLPRGPPRRHHLPMRLHGHQSRDRRPRRSLHPGLSPRPRLMRSHYPRRHRPAIRITAYLAFIILSYRVVMVQR